MLLSVAACLEDHSRGCWETRACLPFLGEPHPRALGETAMANVP